MRYFLKMLSRMHSLTTDRPLVSRYLDVVTKLVTEVDFRATRRK
jgi:hypothetical protein